MFQKPVSRAAEKRTLARDSARQWQAVRRVVLARDHRQCRACGARDAVDVHHIQFRSRGGANTSPNLAVLCRVCHAELHAYRLVIVGGNADQALSFLRSST